MTSYQDIYLVTSISTYGNRFPATNSCGKPTCHFPASIFYGNQFPATISCGEWLFLNYTRIQKLNHGGEQKNCKKLIYTLLSPSNVPSIHLKSVQTDIVGKKYSVIVGLVLGHPYILITQNFFGNYPRPDGLQLAIHSVRTESHIYYNRSTT